MQWGMVNAPVPLTAGLDVDIVKIGAAYKCGLNLSERGLFRGADLAARSDLSTFLLSVEIWASKTP